HDDQEDHGDEPGTHAGLVPGLLSSHAQVPRLSGRGTSLEEVRVRRAVAASLATVLTAAGVAACGHDDSPSASRLTWQEAGLPAPDGQRAVVRDVTWCSGRWVVVGATADAAGNTRPAAWASTNARDWQTLRLRPGSDFYTAQEVLSSVACSDGRLALFGAKP